MFNNLSLPNKISQYYFLFKTKLLVSFDDIGDLLIFFFAMIIIFALGISIRKIYLFISIYEVSECIH